MLFSGSYFGCILFGTILQPKCVSVIRESTNKLDYEKSGLWPFMPQRDEIVKFIYVYIVFYSAVLLVVATVAR